MIKRWFADRSIFLKLILILLSVTFLVNFVVIGFFQRFSVGPRAAFGQFIRGCTQYAVASLGNPPVLERARLMGEDLGISFRYEATKGSFTTDPALASSNEIHLSAGQPVMRWRAENSPFASEMRFGHVGRRPYMILSRPDGLVLVAPNFTFEHEEAWVRLLFLACFLSAIFFITYIGLRRIFRPLHLLSAGVKQVASGNLDVQIQVNSHDELGHLSQAFNQMTSEVKKNLHSKEQLLYNVSHELRSPLTRIKLSLEFLPPSKRRDEIGEEVDQMEAMIDELLESARLESAYGVLAKQRVELGLLLSDLAHKETHPVQIKQTEPIFIQADPRRLERLLSNLIGNAVKHSPQEVPVEVSLSQSGLEVKISIEDQGPGIPEEDRPFLFEPFYRVDKSRNQRTGGYGLGLSLAQQIAEAHGGQITIEEKPTPGSRFVLRLPV